jgi:hypothetical protein
LFPEQLGSLTFSLGSPPQLLRCFFPPRGSFFGVPAPRFILFLIGGERPSEGSAEPHDNPFTGEPDKIVAHRKRTDHWSPHAAAIYRRTPRDDQSGCVITRITLQLALTHTSYSLVLPRISIDQWTGKSVVSKTTWMIRPPPTLLSATLTAFCLLQPKAAVNASSWAATVAESGVAAWLEGPNANSAATTGSAKAKLYRMFSLLKFSADPSIDERWRLTLNLFLKTARSII